MNSYGMRQPTESGTTDHILEHQQQQQQQQQQLQQQQQHSFLKDKRAWENAIGLYQGPDPLDHWWNYICWYENHGHNDPDNKFRETLERCLTLYEHSDYYKQDVRMIRLWLKYIDMQSNPLHFYQVLHQRGVGKQVACFYIDWASYYEAINAYKEAEAVYNLAFQEKAQPYADLHHAHSKFIYTKMLNVQTQTQTHNQNPNHVHIQTQHDRHPVVMQQHYNHIEPPPPSHVHGQSISGSGNRVECGEGHDHLYRQHISYQLPSQVMNHHNHHSFQQSQPQFQLQSQPQSQSQSPQQNHSHQHHVYNHNQQQQQQQQQMGQHVQAHNHYQSQLQQQHSQMLGNALQQHQQRPSVQQQHHHHQQQQQTNEMFFNATNLQHHLADNRLHNNHYAANSIKSNQIMLQQNNSVPIEQQLPAVNVAMLRQRYEKVNDIFIKQEQVQQQQQQQEYHQNQQLNQQYQQQQQQFQQQQQSSSQQQQQQHSPCVTLTPIPGIKLPKKFSNYCRNNHETWHPALYLDEPYDPQRVCHYDKHLVYPKGAAVEYSPEEIKARRYMSSTRQQQQQLHQHQQIKIEQHYENEQQQQVPIDEQHEYKVSVQHQQHQQQYDTLKHTTKNNNLKIAWHTQQQKQQQPDQQQQQQQQQDQHNRNVHGQQMEHQQQQQQQMDVQHRQQQAEQTHVQSMRNWNTNEGQCCNDMQKFQQQRLCEQHYDEELQKQRKCQSPFLNDTDIVQIHDSKNAIVVLDAVDNEDENKNRDDSDNYNDNNNYGADEAEEEVEEIETYDKNNDVPSGSHTIEDIDELNDNQNGEPESDVTNDDNSDGEAEAEEEEACTKLTNEQKHTKITLNQSKAFNAEDDDNDYHYDNDNDDEYNDNDNDEEAVEDDSIVHHNNNDDDENDVEDQIEASTIRFRTLSGTQNKTIKIRFKKEIPTSGNSNTPSAYKIERIYHHQPDIESPNISGMERKCGTKRSHSFHPYLVVHTSTPKSSMKCQRSKQKRVTTNGRFRNSSITITATTPATTTITNNCSAKNTKFNLITNENSNSSSAAETEIENFLANSPSEKVTYNYNNNDDNSNNNNHNINNNNNNAKRYYDNDTQMSHDHVENANYNDNANYSFSSAVALDNSNCSLSNAVGRLNFRDANATLNNSCSQMQQTSTAATTLGNTSEISTYQESSYFTAHSTDNKNNSAVREQRLAKALETIERHLTKEAIDPFNSELCRAFLTKLNFPEHFEKEDINSTYKIIHTPLPKVANTRRLNLPHGVQFNIDKEIGRGSYGSVYKATDINSGSVVALKYQKPANTWEIYICDQVLKRISGAVLPGLMDMSTAIIAPNASLIATEFSPYGSLLDVNNKIRQATTKVMHESLVMHFSAQICNIIYYLHRSQIIHADIKPDNFLLMRAPSTELHYPSLRLIDFGCAIDMTLFPKQTKFRKVIQTDGFTCVEMQEGRPWSYETDLFCIAGTVHVMLFGEYMQLQKRSDKWDIKQKLPRYLKKNVWSQFFGDILNMNSERLPDLSAIRLIFDEEAAKMDSELQKQIRTLSNILHRR